jgi:hypothetical protein
VVVVGRGRWLLEGVTFPHAAVYHTGEVHSHGEGRGHGSQQRLRNGRSGRGGEEQ